MKSKTTGTSNSGDASRFSKRSKPPVAPSLSKTTRTQRATATAKKSKPKRVPKKKTNPPTLRVQLNEPRKPLHESILANIPPRWKHQNETFALTQKSPLILDLSDPGTGKTRSHLDAFAERRRQGSRAALVVAPKSLLRTAWFDDTGTFAPDMLCSVAYASNREQAFNAEADIYITNTDAVNWLIKQPKKFFSKFDTILIDELIAFKHRTSGRSKAIAKMIGNFEYRTGLNGTFTGGSILDTWHQAFLIDGGERLGRNFYQFRQATCEPQQIGPRAEHIKWVDKEGSVEAVSGLLSDISIRHIFNKVMDVPPNYTRTIKYYPSTKLLKAYADMEKTAMLRLSSGNISAVNAAVLRNKLLQIASGAVYDEEGNSHVIDKERYELVLDLATEVKHSIVFFNWSHQKEEIARIATARRLPFAIIDGKVPVKQRETIVKAYQAGEYQFILLHPQTGAHGLTLTRGTRTVWASPIYQPDFLKQGNHRIFRGGQTEVTESILVEAEHTVEKQVYEMLNEKNARMMSLLDLIGTR